jgi:uncharacterized protein YbbC (DUF1343 family)
MLYPGTGLWEGIQINEGRGSDKPFEQLGAPWINGEQLADILHSILQNVVVTPVQYIPRAGIYSNESCNGIELQITKPSAYRAVESGILILQTILRLYPQQARERLYITNANPTGERHMEKLLGCKYALERLKNRESINIDVSEFWYGMIHPYLLYS